MHRPFPDKLHHRLFRTNPDTFITARAFLEELFFRQSPGRTDEFRFGRRHLVLGPKGNGGLLKSLSDTVETVPEEIPAR